MKSAHIRVITKWLVVLVVILVLHPLVCPAAQANPDQPQKVSTDYPSTPEGVVEAYVKAGFEVTSLEELAESSDVDERLQYQKEPHSPGYDCWPLVSAYKIVKMSEDRREARVKVIYENIGAACALGLRLSKQKQEEVIYRLRKQGTYWKIDFPYGPPHVSVNTAIRVYERHTKLFPDRKERLEEFIDILRKYTNSHGSERKEMEE